MSSSRRVCLDINSPGFQHGWFSLSKEEAEELRGSLRLIHHMTWDQVYHSKGLHWEAIGGTEGWSGQKLYSIRITRKFRAIVTREKDFMRFLSVHPDHDSAYH